MTESEIYRQESLDRLRAPEQLDRLLVVVDRKAWVTMSILAFLCAGGVFWAVFGRIPVTVDGFGVMINPGNVRGIQSQADGQIVELLAREGQSVDVGDVLAELNQPELRTQLEQKKEQRYELLQMHSAEEQRDAARRDLESSAIAREQTFVTGEIEKLEQLARTLRDQHAAYAERQRASLKQSRELTSRLGKQIGERLAAVEQLRREGLTSEELVLSARTADADNQTRLADLEVQFLQLDLQEIQTEQSFLEQQNRISDLRLQQLQLQIREQRLVQELEDKARIRRDGLRELDDAIERLELALAEESQIISREAGRILEVSVAGGQVVGRGTRIGAIEIDDPDARLKAVAYFNVGDGKRIRPGDPVRVTPATVRRERYGAIIGQVVDVSGFPITPEAAVNVVGNNQIAQALMQQGGAIEVEIELERDSESYSGYRWTSQGPPLRISPGTTATVRVLTEERAPISYVLPILRTWVFGQKDDRRPEM